MHPVVVLALACTLAVPFAARSKEVSTGPVDHAVVSAPAPSPPAALVVKAFSTENTDFGSGEKPGKEKYQDVAENMRVAAPPALLQTLLAHLEDKGGFAGLSAHDEGKDPAGALVVEGEFTVLNPGSRGKRFWVGMGAGRSRVCVKGRILSSTGEVLATFDHCRSGTGAWSLAGGKSEGMMFNDLSGTAEHLADFLSQWAQGRYVP